MLVRVVYLHWQIQSQLKDECESSESKTHPLCWKLFPFDPHSIGWCAAWGCSKNQLLLHFPKMYLRLLAGTLTRSESHLHVQNYVPCYQKYRVLTSIPFMNTHIPGTSCAHFIWLIRLIAGILHNFADRMFLEVSWSPTITYNIIIIVVYLVWVYSIVPSQFHVCSLPLLRSKELRKTLGWRLLLPDGHPIILYPLVGQGCQDYPAIHIQDIHWCHLWLAYRMGRVLFRYQILEMLQSLEGAHHEPYDVCSRMFAHDFSIFFIWKDVFCLQRTSWALWRPVTPVDNTWRFCVQRWKMWDGLDMRLTWRYVLYPDS